jgi:hypothetical protein
MEELYAEGLATHSDPESCVRFCGLSTWMSVYGQFDRLSY